MTRSNRGAPTCSSSRASARDSVGWLIRNAVAALGARQKFIRPHCPWTNGKVERLNRTLATEWAYTRAYTSNTERAKALPPWLEHYNLERPHTGIAGLCPIERINNAAG